MSQKLLLIEDVESLGRSGDIVSVKPGYARNYLLPRGIATVATKNAIRMQARLQEERAKQAVIDREESEQISKSLEGVSITTEVKVDHEGHMYGSVSIADIQHLLEKEKILLEKRSIQLKHPIKETGVFNIEVKLKEGVSTSFTLKVVAEGQAIAEPEPEAPKE